MGQPCWTKLGYCLDEDLMDFVVHTEMGPNYIKTYHTWTMKEDLVVEGSVVATKGEVMRQDAAPSMLAGPGQKVLQGKLNGQ